ncbi:peptidoglycan-binding domain-containing protein [Xanthomonas campestris]|uniref:peptidoglycan-binding domain-containing protein n=1 Tax=Xanthomonas campestris TaxID=339 RepID=UPI0032E49BE7
MDVVDQAKQKMDSWHIGQTSAHRESGGRGPGTVSTGVGDHGGISYGTYQFSTNTGGASEYVAASAYRGRFAGLQPGTQEFGAKWQEVAAADPAGFAKDQHDFIQTLYYDKQMQRLQDVGIDLSGRGAAVQDALWSTSVQYRDLTRSVFQTGLKEAYGENYNLAQLTDEQIIRVAQDYKVGHIETNFKSSPDWWPGLRDRAVSEKGDLVALARYDAVNRNPEPYRGKDYQQAFGEQEPQQSRGRARANPMADGMLVSGERGAEVEALQNKLIQAGYSGKDGQPLSPDKHYGSNTEYAVREFQKANGLTEDGKAGKDTLDALDNAVRQQGNAMPGLVVPAEHVALAPTAPVQQKEQVAPARDLVRGERIQVIEPMGSADNKTNRTIPHGTSGNEAFRDLQIHHPKANHEAVRTGNAALADRHSEMIGGELETVRNTGDRNGTPLVHKDLILTDQEGLRAVMIPNPVAGYVEVNENKWNSISIWSHPAGHPNRELLGQVLHGERGSSPYKTGDYVEYGAPLIKQSDAGSPGAVHAHIELEPDQYRKYLGDMLNDRLTLDRNAPTRTAPSQNPMADSMLTKTERGDEVKAMQEKLAGLGYQGKDGKLLSTTGYFGEDTFAAVQAFQRANGMNDDGKAGNKTLAALDAAVAQKQSPKAEPSMRDASNLDNARFEQAVGKLQIMEKQRAQAGMRPVFTDDEQIERAAGQLVVASKVAGMDRIDSVVARLDGSGVFAVQGEMTDPAARRALVEHSQAVSQTVEASTRQAEQANTQSQDQQREQEQNRARGM